MTARNIDLEAAILATPWDPAVYAVYADWLQGEGDPRGELIVLSQRDRDLEAAHRQQHAEQFLGRFARATPEKFELEWRFGFIQSATIGWEMFAGEDEDDTCAQQLTAFLRLESARFLESLTLGPTSHDDAEMNLGPLARAIDEVPPIMLRELELGEIGDWDISSTSTRIPRSESIRGLHELTLCGGTVYLDDIDLPELRSFAIHSGSLTAGDLQAIASARWPKLESLEIWCGDPNYGASGGPLDLAPILEARGLANLRVLRLQNCPFADELVDHLAASKILPQIHTLDVSMGNLSDRGLATMLAAKDRFGHLEVLDVSDNALTEQHWPAARVLAKTVTFGDDHSPERAVPRTDANRYRRFVSVGE